MEEAGPSSPKRQRLCDAGPSSSVETAASAPAVCPDLPPDIIGKIGDLLMSEKDAFHDEADCCEIAASLCLTCRSLGALGSYIYQRLSPRLDEDLDGLTEHSTATTIKKKLKEWGLVLTGTKAGVWTRLSDEVTPVHAEHCPVARSVQKRAKLQQEEYVSINRCKNRFGVYQYLQSGNVPFKVEPNTKPGKEPQKLYSLKHVKILARKHFGSEDKLKESQEAGKASWKQTLSRIDRRKQQVRDELLKRGMDEEDASRGMDLLWYYGHLGVDGDPDAPNAAESIANTCLKVEEFIWLMHHTIWAAVYVGMRNNHVLANLKERAADMALKDWVRDEKFVEGNSLEVVLATPGLPPALEPEIRRIWSTPAS